MWLSVSLPADARCADLLSDALLERGAISVSVEDALAGTDEEAPQFDEPGLTGADGLRLWPHSRVIALFESRNGVEALREDVLASCRTLGIDVAATIRIEEVPEQDWVRLTQSQFAPIRINERMWIVPTWHEAPDPAAINLVLDPGLAFGTGSHPTTRLCLEWLSDTVRGGETLLDYGCGSGILAIAAARLGAAEVLGVDIDDNALVAAGDNATANGVALRLCHSRENFDGVFDRVVANILSNPLRVLAPLLVARVAPGGRIALSGVLESQADEIIAAYAPLLRLSVGARLDGWVRLDGGKEMSR